MPDEIDMAQAVEEKYNRGALNKALSREEETPLELAGVRVCLDCEDPIDPARMAANPKAVRCIRCQEHAEKR